MTTDAATSLAIAIGGGLGLTVLAGRLRLPAILLLLGAGVALGVHGVGVVDAGTLGDAFEAMVEVAIGLLIFEGSLHLGWRELARAPRAVAGLLTIGVAITGVGVAMAAHFVLGMDWSLAAVLGAILTVTGPTVIQPILRRLPLSPGLHMTLRAEGILVDPIGVLLTVSAAAVAVRVGDADAAVVEVIRGAGRPIGLGLLAGAIVGVAAALVHWRLTKAGPRDGEASLHALGACMLAIAAGEMLAHGGGLFAAAACGMVLANLRAPGVGEVHRFGAQLAILVVGMLFILLASRLDPVRLVNMTWREWVFIALVIFAIRPASVILATTGSALSAPERTFASLFAPRGIVAGSVAAVVGARIAAETDDPERMAQALQIEPLAFATIIATVLWATFAARPLARMVGVAVDAPPGLLIVGAHRMARDLGRVLTVHEIPVHLVDSSAVRVRAAQSQELHAVRGDATDSRVLDDQSPANEIGWMIAWTGNEDVDRAASRWGAERFGQERVLAGVPSAAIPERPAESQPPMPGLTRFQDIEERLESGELIVAAGKPGTIPHPLVYLGEANVVALAPGNGKGAEKAVVVVGLVPREGVARLAKG